MARLGMTQTALRRSEKRAKLLALLPAIEADIRAHLSLTLIYENRGKPLGVSYSYFHQLVTDRLGLSRSRFPGRATKARLRASAAASPGVPDLPAARTYPPSAPPSSAQAPADPRGPLGQPASRQAAPLSQGPSDENAKETADGPKPPAARPAGFQRSKGLPDDRSDLW
jgi:hypothetical protein